jgi:hypothetical protein
MTIMVLKTGLDQSVQSVQPGTDAQSGSVLLKNRKLRKSDEKPETISSTGKTGNQTGPTNSTTFVY